MTNVTYPVWLASFVQECLAFLRTDAKSKTLQATELRPYPVRAEDGEKKQFTRHQIVSALRSYLSIGINGGEGTRPDGSTVEIKGFAKFSDLNAEMCSEVVLAGALSITHDHTPTRGPNKGTRMTYNTMTQTIKRIKSANTALPERKQKARKLTADEKTWLRTNVGPAWWGPGADGKTDPVVKAASIARMDAEMGTDVPTDEVATPSSPVVDTTTTTAVSGVTARVVELRKEFPDMSVAEAKELAELGL